MPRFKRPHPSMIDPTNHKDWCIIVNQEEIDADGDFQCSKCGTHEDGIKLNPHDDIPVERECRDCGTKFEVHPYSIEL